ncbi:MAG TPA: ScpA family protein [Candidatus Paceibacterota bacterium]|nr:ScpA family protein [Candidatus Paceibacterota bacterium]
MTGTGYKVQTHVFEGPLELLLDLIEKRKFFINDVSLAKVADDYIEYVKKLGDFPVAESAQFVLIASTLLLIKSKSLLPTLPLTQEEEGNIRDLEDRLKIYQRMRELSLHVKVRFGEHILFERGDRPVTPVFSPDESMTLENIKKSIFTILLSLPKKEFLPQAIVQKVMSLEHMIENLTERVSSSIKMSFRDFAKVGKEHKVNVIVGFLAMLELVKQGVITVTQEKHFDDIHMESESVGIPRY